VKRETRIRKAIPGAPDELVAELAGLPVAELDRWLPALRQARKDALEADRARRAQAREDRRQFRHHDEEQLTGATMRIISGAGKRATVDLEALAGLAAFARHIDELMAVAVDGLRARGIPDPEIAAALGTSRQAVGQRYGRKGPQAGPGPEEAAAVNDGSPDRAPLAWEQEAAKPRPVHRYDLEVFGGKPREPLE
jgi:hypothetical protein